MRSGSLITARMAGEQGRDVFAVPGYPGDPRAQGPNKLIRDGATLVQSASDILEALESFSGGNAGLFDTRLQAVPAPEPSAAVDEKDTEEIKEAVLQNISQMPLYIDELARACHVPIPGLQMALLELELGGRVQRLPGNRIVRLDD
jgi:DNA processing protein